MLRRSNRPWRHAGPPRTPQGSFIEALQDKSGAIWVIRRTLRPAGDDVYESLRHAVYRIEGASTAFIGLYADFDGEEPGMRKTTTHRFRLSPAGDFEMEVTRPFDQLDLKAEPDRRGWKSRTKVQLYRWNGQVMDKVTRE
jgi:hypothetical protein